MFLHENTSKVPRKSKDEILITNFLKGKKLNPQILFNTFVDKSKTI